LPDPRKDKVGDEDEDEHEDECKDEEGSK